jgi:hypothetical protein
VNNDFRKLQAVVKVLKVRFNNLNVEEVNDIAIKVIEAVRDQASLRYIDSDYGSFEVFGSQQDIENLHRTLSSMTKRIDE